MFVRLDRTVRIAIVVTAQPRVGDGPRSLVLAVWVGVAGLFVRFGRTIRIAIVVADQPRVGDSPRSFGVGGVGGGQDVRQTR